MCYVFFDELDHTNQVKYFQNSIIQYTDKVRQTFLFLLLDEVKQCTLT